MLAEIIKIAAITLLPFLELRASIPYGFIALGKESWLIIFMVAVISNIILGIIIFPFIDFIMRNIRKIRLLDRLYRYYVLKTQKKIDKAVEKYGELGLAVFIGIPLPGSGVYSGSVAAYLMGMKYKKFIISSVLGVTIAGIVVTIIMLSGTTAFTIFTKGS